MLDADQIRLKLKDANIRKVARGCGVDHQAILRLMKGHGIRKESMERLSGYLGCGNDRQSAE